MTTASPTIFAVQTDSAWVVIVAVSLVTLPATLLLRRLIRRPGGVSSGLLLMLPLVLPLIAAGVYHHGVLPEIGVLRPAGQAVLRKSSDLLHLLWVSDGKEVVTPYALWGSAGPWLLVIGLGFSSFMLIRRFTGMVLVMRLVRECRRAHPHRDRDLVTMVDSVARTAGLARRPQILLLPPGVSGAFALGSRRAKILISAELLTRLDPDEVEGIVAHEVAHIKARDARLVFFAGLLRDVVAWNPLGHIAYRRFAADRELEADRRAAALTGRPLAVASGLLKAWEAMRSAPRRRHRAALAFVRPGRRISKRVARLIDLADGRVALAPARSLHFVAAGCLVAVLGLQAAARVVDQGNGAVAILWGAPTATDHVWSADVGVRRGPATQAVDPKDKRRAPISRARYRALLASPAVHERDFQEWIALATRLARKEEGSRTAWEQRRDWQVIPVLPETLGVGVYRIEEGLPAPIADDPH